jgi:hypothetical protein
MSKHKNGVIVLSTLDIIRGWFSKRKRFENKQSLFYNMMPPEPLGEKVISIAIVLDEEVQEIIRAQSGLASLFLSNPSFVEIGKELDPESTPTIGWKYVDGKFFKKHVFVREHDVVWSVAGDTCEDTDCALCNGGGMVVATLQDGTSLGLSATRIPDANRTESSKEKEENDK